MLKFIPGIFALALVGFYSVRGAESFTLAATAGGVWTVALLLMSALLGKSSTSRERVRGWFVFGLLWGVAASIVFTSWPLRIAPIVYRRQFESVATRIASGQPLIAPEQIGPFRIQRGEMERGFVCLWLDLNSSGRSGFIRSVTPQKSTFNDWSLIAAGAGWQFLVED